MRKFLEFTLDILIFIFIVVGLVVVCHVWPFLGGLFIGVFTSVITLLALMAWHAHKIKPRHEISPTMKRLMEERDADEASL